MLKDLIVLVFEYYSDTAYIPIINKHWYGIGTTCPQYWSKRRVIRTAEQVSLYCPPLHVLQRCNRWEYKTIPETQQTTFYTCTNQLNAELSTIITAQQCHHLTLSTGTGFHFRDALLHFSSLISLEIQYMNHSYIVAPQHFVAGGLPHLKRLICGKQFDSSLLLLSLLQVAPQLEHLHVHLQNHLLTDGLSIVYLEQTLSNLTHLTSFEGNLCDNLTSELYQTWSRTLEKLHYYHHPQGMIKLWQQCMKTDRLVVLKTTVMSSAEYSLLWMCRNLESHQQSLSRLTTLDLSREGFDWDLCRAHCNSLGRHIPNLQHFAIKFRPCIVNCRDVCTCNNRNYHQLHYLIQLWRKTLQSVAICVPVLLHLNGLELGRALVNCERLRMIRITEANVPTRRHSNPAASTRILQECIEQCTAHHRSPHLQEIQIGIDVGAIASCGAFYSRKQQWHAIRYQLAFTFSALLISLVQTKNNPYVNQ